MDPALACRAPSQPPVELSRIVTPAFSAALLVHIGEPIVSEAAWFVTVTHNRPVVPVVVWLSPEVLYSLWPDLCDEVVKCVAFEQIGEHWAEHRVRWYTGILQ